jgi:Glutaredoxin
VAHVCAFLVGRRDAISRFRRDGGKTPPLSREWIIVVPVAVKLHRCSTKWKVGPCWRVQKALDEQGIDYEVVKGPARPGKRADLQRLSGQKLYPVVEFENGSIYREESKDMAATIRAGKLDEKRGAAS